MKITRRKLLGTAGVATIAVTLPLPGCGGDDPPAPAPDGGPLDASGDAGTDAPVTPDGGPPDGGPPPATGPFRHGVASGDPLPDSVIL